MSNLYNSWFVCMYACITCTIYTDLCRYYELHNSICDINFQSPVSDICKKKKTSETDKNNIFLFSCWLKFDKPVTYTMLRKIFVYALIYAVVVFTFTNASLNSGNTITKYQLANTNNTVPDRWKIVIGYYMYQYCIYVGNSGTYNLELWFSNH